MLNVPNYALAPEMPTYYRIPDAAGYDALGPHRIEALLRAAQPTPGSHALDLPLLGLMSVRSLVDFRADPGALQVSRYRLDDDPCRNPFVIATNPHFLPRARLAGGAVIEADDERALALLRELAFPRERSVVLAAGTPRAAAASDIGTAAIVLARPEQVRVAIAPTAPGWLVLSDTFFPGWKALVDGAPREIARANVAFRAVAVEPGERVVEFRYEPFWYRCGAVVSLAAVTLALLGWLTGARRSLELSA
jgi:hypothetical protein